MSGRAAKDLRFIRRLRVLRALGLGLGFFCVAGVFYQNGAHPLQWAILAFNGFVWPQLAYFLARSNADPQKAEFRNLLIDSTLGGVWVALMQFNLLPSVVLVTMLSMDKICVGGWRFLSRTAAAQVLACLVVSALNGFQFRPVSGMTEILACLPFLVAYPVAVATATYALSRTVTRQNKLLEELNRIDSLTGLLNRGAWENALVSELRRHQRLGRPAALLMMDIDRFKPINDQRGHPAGDEVIRAVARLIQGCVRDVDTAGRYGGDEFGIVLPDADLQQAIVVAERIRHSVENCALGPDGGLRCTVSIGLAAAGADMAGGSDWIAQADTALYRAKTQGRNRIDGALHVVRHTA